jgi:hypothetical protein
MYKSKTDAAASVFFRKSKSKCQIFNFWQMKRYNKVGLLAKGQSKIHKGK